MIREVLVRCKACGYESSRSCNLPETHEEYINFMNNWKCIRCEKDDSLEVIYPTSKGSKQ